MSSDMLDKMSEDVVGTARNFGAAKALVRVPVRFKKTGENKWVSQGSGLRYWTIERALSA